MAQKAPGRHFRKGMSLVEITAMFPDDEAAEAWFTANRWPDGPHCPHCGSTNVLSGAAHKTMPYRCRERECRKRFSVRTNTAMDSSNIGYRQWAIAFYLFATNLKGVSSMKLHRDLGITQKSAWFMAHRIRQAMHDQRGPFDGPVEADETYVGGKRKNMHVDKRRGMQGRGAVGKAAVAGVRDRETKHVTARVVANTDAKTLKAFVRFHAGPWARVYTDEAGAYRGLERHESVNHSHGEYVRGDVHTNGIESFWASLKRGIVGTFHHVSVKHLDRYLAEFAGRVGDRDADTVDMMAHMVARMDGRRLTYHALIGKPRSQLI